MIVLAVLAIGAFLLLCWWMVVAGAGAGAFIAAALDESIERWDESEGRRHWPPPPDFSQTRDVTRRGP